MKKIKIEDLQAESPQSRWLSLDDNRNGSSLVFAYITPPAKSKADLALLAPSEPLR